MSEHYRYFNNYHQDNCKSNDFLKGDGTISHYQTNANKKTHKMLGCFDSRFRSNAEDTNTAGILFNLPFTIKNVLSVRLSNLELPICWYTFSDTRKSNRIYIKEYFSKGSNSGINEGLISLQEGNYTSIEFGPVLTAQLNLELNTDEFNVIVGVNELTAQRFSVVVDSNSGKTTISNSMFPFDIFFLEGDVNANKMINMGWYMGFRETIYTGEQQYTSESIFVTSENDYLYFVMDEYSNHDSNSIIIFLNNSYVDKNILARVAISVDKFQVLYDDGRDMSFKKREYLGPINISKLKFELLDRDGTLFDLHKLDWSFTIEFEILDEFSK